jgi:glycosyltransferase involved in cell wall biosynthesis
VPRLLHVAQPTDGGVAAYLHSLVVDQARRGLDVVVAVPDGPVADALGASGVARERWPAHRSPIRGTAREAWRVAHMVERLRPDLVHLHSSKAGLDGRLALRGGVPTLFQPHGWSWLAVRGATATAARRWERLAARWANRVVCVSAAEQELAVAAGVRGRFSVVRTGVDSQRFAQAGPQRRVQARAQTGLPDGPLVVCVGRITAAKGQDLLVSAWPLVRDRHPDAQLAIVGAGRLADGGEGVHFVGPSDDVASWYAAAEVVAVPSRWDALSLTLLEACAVGSSIVATDVPGVREVLGRDGERGAVVAPTPLAIGAAIAARLADAALRTHERALTAEFAAREFTQERAFEEMTRLVEDVLGEGPVRPRRVRTTSSSGAGF